VGRFRQFVAAWNNGSGWTPGPGSGKHAHLNAGQGLVDVGAPAGAGVVYETGWLPADDFNIEPTDRTLACQGPHTWTSSVGIQENLPINCVNWYEAYAFCIWDGGFLPSEAEWIYASVGGNEQRWYPWGAMAPGANDQYAIFGCDYPNGSGVCAGVSSIAPVGTATSGAGRWGQLDLVGELYEWMPDWSAPYVTPCVDCAYLTQPMPSSDRVMRGGTFGDWSGNLGAASGQLPSVRIPTLGFRCARSP
jgi:formylglycine-generating enzyme required for sulfatase activity